MHLSSKYISALCLLVTGIYAQGGPTGSDTGNTFCMGPCKENPHELSCGTTAVASFREHKGCYACCFNDDHIDDFADHMDDVVPGRKD